MKKKLFFLLIPLVISGMTGCVKYNGRGKSRRSTSTPAETTSVAPSGSSSKQGKTSEPVSDELPIGTEVKVYLVFGPNGLYKGNPVNTTIDALFLEHAMELTTKVGDHLPTRDDVTSSVSGSKFAAWTSYNNDGKLTEYTKVPGYDKKILYASFTGGGGQGGGGSSSSQPSGGGSGSSSQAPATLTYTVTGLQSWVRDDGCVIFAWVWGAQDGGSWKSLTFGNNNDASFTVDNALDGFLLARCKEGTTQPDWNKHGDDHSVGRVYNQTNNINCTAGVYSYACTDWVDYN